MQLFASQRQNIEQHVIKEARYLAIAVKHPSLEQQEINFIYPIIGVEQKKRFELLQSKLVLIKLKRQIKYTGYLD